MKDQSRFRRLLWRLSNRHIYQFFSDLCNAFWIIQSEGLNGYRSLTCRVPPCGEKYCQVYLHGLGHPLNFRPSTADSGTIVQSLIREEYGRVMSNNDPAVIIDAGAFIGDATLFFHRRFPRARIISLEPNEDNYALAALNLNPYQNSVTLLKAGLWSHAANVKVVGDSTGSRLVECDESNDSATKCIDVSTLMLNYSIERLDILKMDIEGAEGEVLARNYEKWLPLTNQLIIEFHGEEIQRKGLRTLEAYGFKVFRYRSLFYCYNQSPAGKAVKCR